MDRTDDRLVETGNGQLDPADAFLLGDLNLLLVSQPEKSRILSRFGIFLESFVSLHEQSANAFPQLLGCRGGKSDGKNLAHLHAFLGNQPQKDPGQGIGFAGTGARLQQSHPGEQRFVATIESLGFAHGLASSLSFSKSGPKTRPASEAKSG